MNHTVGQHKLNQAKHKTRIRLAGIAGLVAQAVIVLFVFMPCVRHDYTCPRCRLQKTVQSFWWIPITTYETNACSGWYTALHPDHKHNWGKSDFVRIRWGSIYQHSERPTPPSIYRVTPESQKMYLSTCNEKEQEAWFELIASKKASEYELAIWRAAAAGAKALEKGKPSSGANAASPRHSP